MNPTEYTVGQKVYVKYFGSWRWFYTTGVVSKVTPAGMVDVIIGHQSTSTRFRPNGKVQKLKDLYSTDYELDDISYEERVALIASEDRAKNAVNLINLVKAENVRETWGKDGLLAEVNRLQELLMAARTAVEGI